MKMIVKILAGWMLLFLFQPLFAQNLMVIHQGNGTKIQLPIESIDSIRFVSLPPPVVQKIFQNNGNVLALTVSDIDSITYDLPNPQSLPQVSTQAVTALGTSSVYAQGAVLSDGGSPVTQRGFCWSLQPMPSLANNYTTNGSGNGSFGASISPLQAGTLYYVRAYASNSSGTTYGAQLTVTTQAPASSGNLPTVSTTQVQYTPAQGFSAICGGNVTADGGLAVTARGVCWVAGTTPTLNHNFTVDGAGGGNFTSNLSNLLPNTTYFVRAYATNDAGTAYGLSYAFTTGSTYPTVITTAISNLTPFSALSGGIVLANSGGPIIERGVCWSINPNPTILLNTKTVDGSGTGTFISTITGISSNSTYYVRAYARNNFGVAYGNEITFSYLEDTTFLSVDSVQPSGIFLENYTGQFCGNCPNANRIAMKLDSIYNKLVVMSIHAGYFADPANNPVGNDFRCDAGNQLDSQFNLVSQSIPKGLINRSRFGGTVVAKLNPASWQAKVVELSQRPPSPFTFYIRPNFNDITNSIYVKTYVKFRTPYLNNLKIALYLVEDSVQNWQLDYSSQPSAIPDYLHRNVLRDSFLPINNADPLMVSPFNTGQIVEKQWVLPLRPGINPSKCKIIGIAYNPIDYEVFQVVELKTPSY